jgi:hypothetical protein
MVKPGLRTTEFWVSVLTDVGVIAASSSGVLPAKYAAITAGISTLAYSISRGISKNGSAGV